MPDFLTPEELLQLEVFHTKLELNASQVSDLKKTDEHRMLRTEMLTERINALRLEIESLKLPDKKLWDTLMLRYAQGEQLRNDNKAFVATLKEKYGIPEDEDFGFDPDTGQVIRKDEKRLGLEDQEKSDQ